MLKTEAEAKQYVAERCDAKGLQKLERFVALLKDENDRQNLVAKATLDQVWQRHVADSVQLLGFVPRETSRVFDLGSGAGLPGLVWAIVRPSDTLMLVESRRKRIEWLERAAHALDLTNCHVLGSRLEAVESFPADVITARAFAPLPQLIALAERFSTKGTTWVLPKGRSAAQECGKLPKHWQVMFHVEQSLTDEDAGILVGSMPSE